MFQTNVGIQEYLLGGGGTTTVFSARGSRVSFQTGKVNFGSLAPPLDSGADSVFLGLVEGNVNCSGASV